VAVITCTFAKFPQLNFGVINTLKKFGRNDKWFLKLVYIVKVGSFQVTKNVERGVFVCGRLKADLDVCKFAFVPDSAEHGHCSKRLHGQYLKQYLHFDQGFGSMFTRFLCEIGQLIHDCPLVSIQKTMENHHV
jgi:hypothetical protein